VGKEPAYALTIRARQPESKAGCSEIWVEVAFKNISDRDIEITPRLAYLVSAGHAKSFYASDVRDEKGNSVPETELGRKIGKGDALCIGSAWEALGEQHYAPLRPGESRTNQIHLNKCISWTMTQLERNRTQSR
jgi:hypothetical protein